LKKVTVEENGFTLWEVLDKDLTDEGIFACRFQLLLPEEAA
jgi:hypothetical protein